MTNNLAINIQYWAYQEDGRTLSQPEGMDTFVAELQSEYVARVHGRPADLGGGLYQLAVQIVATIAIGDVVKLIADGVAFDLLKAGAKSFVLRPFLNAFAKLKSSAKSQKVDISELRFVFNDAEILITSVRPDSLYENIGEIFKFLVENFQHLQANGNESPYEITIPVFQDPTGEICRYRTLLDVDETIENVSVASYFGLWGVQYDFDRTVRVYDVERKQLIDADFLTVDEYWKKWDEHCRRTSAA